MRYDELKKKFEAVQKIFSADSTTPDKIRSLQSLLTGINPKIDGLLKEITKTLSTLEKIEKTELITLTVEAIPENTEVQKRRKKLLLLFIRLWKDLQSEVARVQKELDNDQNSKNATQKAQAWGNIAAAAKGPLGLITVVAVGLVTLQATAVTVTIRNEGCDPILPVSKFPISVPGLRLPGETIPPGGSATASLPPLSLSVDAKTPGRIILSGFKQQYTFDLADSGIDLLYNGRSLLGQTTVISLSKNTPQTITARCR